MEQEHTLWEAYPLSDLQQGMLFHSLAAPKEGVYLQQFVADLQEAVDVSCLMRAWQHLAERHSALRTSFDWENRETPLQIVHPRVDIPWEQQDWREHPIERKERELEAFLAVDRQLDFDLARPPLFRLTLIRFAEAQYQLVWTSHHALFDGRSRLILLQELFAIYQALRVGDASPLPKAVSFRLHVEWLQAQEFDRSAPFWRDLVTGYENPRLSPAGLSQQQNFAKIQANERETLRLSSLLSSSLRSVATKHDLTLNTLIQGVWAILISRYSGQRRIIFGATRAGRNSGPEQMAQAVGLLINTVPMAVDVDPDAQLLPWLQQLRALWMAMRAHEHTPLSKIQAWSSISAGVSLFDSVVSFETYELNAHLRKQSEQWGYRTFQLRGQNNYPISISGYDGQEILLTIDFDPRLYGREFISRMVGIFHTVLVGLPDNLSQPLSTLSLLTAAERRNIEIAWNQTRREYPRDISVYQIFENNAERIPDSTAIVFADRKLTYRELNANANQLAHYLRRVGVGPDVLVAICADRSLDMVVAILGVLKAGGAYVPLDPSYPKERLAFMLEDCNAQILLAHKSTLGTLPATTATILILDSEWELIEQEAKNNLQNRTTEENLAYVIYTSGSTGKPKGVSMPHRAVSNLINWQLADSTVGEGGRTLQFASPSFDVSFQEIFATLCAGGTLIVPEPMLHKDFAILSKLIDEQRIERLFLPVVGLQQLAEMIGASCTLPRSLREIIVSGEQLIISPAIVHLFEMLPGCTLYNQYGPTETHVVSSHKLTGPPGDWPSLPPLGRPVANTQIYLLDSNRNPVPVDIPGELYIGGTQVSRGYYDRPEMTNERFLSNPFTQEHGARLYKTGDLARYQPDGNIEFLGRIDNQVKIRGFRIEVGEIESVLKLHPAVEECAVVVREDQPGNKRLIAYVKAADSAAARARELRNLLMQKLPDYMVPSIVAFLDVLPLTPNGKINRRALAAKDPGQPETEQDYVAPRTPTEELLSEIWHEVFGLEKVGIEDSFFDLGGHSLLAARLAARMSIVLKQKVSIKFLLSHPTIASLAEGLSASESPTMPFEQNGSVPSEDRAFSELISPCLTVERRPLISLLATGKIPAVQAAAIGYLPDEWLAQEYLSRSEIIDQWYQNLPEIAAVQETSFGRIAIIHVPRFRSEVYDDPSNLVDAVIKILDLAGRNGARVVSLTGLIPSATDYGRAIETVRANRNGLPAVTTGHATTVSAVVLSIQKIAQLAGRDLRQERIGFLGLGSIGSATLDLMLRCLPHPAQITLCDIYQSASMIRAKEIINNSGFRGTIRIVASYPQVPAEFYESTLIIGATNVPEVLDIRQLKPGTMIVDDSAPQCYSISGAIRRLETEHDVLFTDGGVLRSPQPINVLRYLPRVKEAALPLAARERLLRHNPLQITGCVFSSILTASFQDIKPTLGFVGSEEAFDNYQKLCQLGFSAADLHAMDYVVSDNLISSFRNKFGKTADHFETTPGASSKS
jgi:amino acid adenylation domain-containing protein